MKMRYNLNMMKLFLQHVPGTISVRPSLSFGLAAQRAAVVIIERKRLIHGGSGYYHIIHSI